MRRGTPRPWREGGREGGRDRAARTHLCAHLPREPALRPGLALRLQRLRGKGTVKFTAGVAGLLPPAPPPPGRRPPTSPAVGERGSGGVGARARPARLREPGARGPQHLRRRAAASGAGPERRRGRQAGTGRGGACLKGIGAAPAPLPLPQVAPAPAARRRFYCSRRTPCAPGLAGARAPRLPARRPLGCARPTAPGPTARALRSPNAGLSAAWGAEVLPAREQKRPQPCGQSELAPLVRNLCPDGLRRGKELC